jgi:hypothetical protein
MRSLSLIAICDKLEATPPYTYDNSIRDRLLFDRVTTTCRVWSANAVPAANDAVAATAVPRNARRVVITVNALEICCY